MKRVILNVPTDKLRTVCDDLRYEVMNVMVVPRADSNWDVYYSPK